MGDSDDAQSNHLIGHTLGKRFLVLRQLGAGGMGAVYEVEHVLTKRVGALKLLHASVARNALMVERFVREASAAGRIGNPHIVETIDAGELPSGEPYIFMELLSGTPVSELIKRRKRLRFEEAREIVLQAAEGLAAAHASGIVHRDVKPENLFVCRGDPARVKLLDFGISKFDVESDHRLTAEGVPMGTPYYMSPEQVAGKRDIGPSSDVYSLGVVLYECVTGRVPFDAATLPALSIKIFEGNYAPPSSVCGEVPGLDALIARAMATAPSQRFASMAELREALLRLDPGVPVSLARTLESKTPASDATSRPAELGDTADLAPVSRTAALDSITPPTMTSPDRRRLSGRWIVTGLSGLAVATAALLLRGGSAPVPAAAPAPPPPSATASNVASVEPPAASFPTPPSASAGGGAPAKPSPRAPATRAHSSHPTPSKAARDGLSEQNPFD